MNKYIKCLALVAVAAVGFSAQAQAASVSVNIGRGISISVNDSRGKDQGRRVSHDMRNARHVDHCRDCRRELARREAARRARFCSHRASMHNHNHR